MKKYPWIILTFLAILSLLAITEFWMGRSPLGPDGKFGLWDGNIWGPENSQRVADVYSFSHIIHGMLFYALLWYLARRLPLRYRFLIAVLMEAGWELLENSPFIIHRYREVTMALGYMGDSILNSVSDIGMAAFGFWLASRWRVGVSVALILLMEVGCLLWVRDNLTLNILMLVHPIDAIKAWQSVARPVF